MMLTLIRKALGTRFILSVRLQTIVPTDKELEAKPLFGLPPFPMRWYDTCSCMAVKLPDTLVHDTVVKIYTRQFCGINGHLKRDFSSVIQGKLSTDKPWEVEEWWECRLDNGVVIQKPKRSFYKAEDGIYEYHN